MAALLLFIFSPWYTSPLLPNTPPPFHVVAVWKLHSKSSGGFSPFLSLPFSAARCGIGVVPSIVCQHEKLKTPQGRS